MKINPIIIEKLKDELKIFLVTLIFCSPLFLIFKDKKIFVLIYSSIFIYVFIRKIANGLR